MEEYNLSTDIKVLCVTATKFPQGIAESHHRLHSLIPFYPEINRRFFGISRPENNSGIVYKAGAEELNPGEFDKLNLEPIILKNGKYISLIISDYAKEIMSIDRAFKELLQYENLDSEGYCVEWYLNEKDVRCMVKLSDN